MWQSSRPHGGRSIQCLSCSVGGCIPLLAWCASPSRKCFVQLPSRGKCHSIKPVAVLIKKLFLVASHSCWGVEHISVMNSEANIMPLAYFGNSSPTLIFTTPIHHSEGNINSHSANCGLEVQANKCVSHFHLSVTFMYASQQRRSSRQSLSSSTPTSHSVHIDSCLMLLCLLYTRWVQ